MAVYRSPFSGALTAAGDQQPKPFNPFEIAVPKASEGKMFISDGQSELLPSASKRVSSVASLAEGRQLDSAFSTALAKIARGNMSDKDKEQARNRVREIYNQGYTNETRAGAGLGGKIMGIAARGLSGIGKVFEPFAVVSRNLQSGIKELDDLVNQLAGPVGTEVYRAVTPDVLTKLLAFDRSKEPKKASFSEFRKQANDKDWKAINTGNKAIDNALDFGVDVVYDPTTYLGVGALNYVGKAGRTELLVKFGTEAMQTKYPQLVDKLDDIARYGVAAIPKEVRAAEGLEYGVKFGGQVIPKTEVLGQMFTGRYGVFSNARALTGDLIGSSEKLAAVRGALTPSSRAGLVALEIGRRKGLTNEQIIPEIAGYTARKFAKGFKSESYKKGVTSFYNDVLSPLQAEIKAGNITSDEAKRIANYVEDYSLVPPPSLQPYVDGMRKWQNDLRDEVNSIYLKFGLDYGSKVKEIGFIDEYVHHKITDEALKFIYGPKGQRSGWFRDGELTSVELGSSVGAAMYRRVKRPKVINGVLEEVEFMGEKVLKGTIEEINAIFQKVTGDSTAKFFEDDLQAIAESYAYSMAATRGREAYVRRLMDFGGDIASVINYKTVPNAKLLASLQKSHQGLLQTRAKLLRKVVKGRATAMSTVKDILDTAEGLLGKKLKDLGLTSKELDDATVLLTNMEAELADAFAAAAKQKDVDRGAFFEAHKVLLEEIQTLRAALANDDANRVLAADAVKTVWMRTFPTRKRPPATVEEMIADIKRVNGIADPKEVRELTKRQAALQKQLAETPPTDPNELNDLLDMEQELTDHINGFTVLEDVRIKADYAEDGMLYGVMDDIIDRPFDPNRDPFPKVLSSRPMHAGDASMSTDELSALRQGFVESPDSVAVHALPVDEVVDLRKPEGFYAFWDNEGASGDMIGFALEQAGVDTKGVFRGVWADWVQTGEIDPLFEQIFPELHDLMVFASSMPNNVFELGVVEDQFLVESFETLKDLFTRAAAANNLENSDVVGVQMMNDFIRAMASPDANLGKPLLLPSGVLFGADNPVADGAFSVVFADDYRYASRFGKKNIDDDLMRGAGAPVHLVSENQFVRSILDKDYVTASLETSETYAAVGEVAQGMMEQRVARQQISDEIRSVSRKRGGMQTQARRRVAAAEKAWDDYSQTGLLEVSVGGKTQKMTRAQVEKLIVNREEKFAAKLAAFDERIAAKDADFALRMKPLKDRVAYQRGRLMTLMNQVKVLQAWDDTTGAVLRDDILRLRTAIATDPPNGPAGTISRAWSDRVNKTLQSIPQIKDKKLAKAWERVVTQLHADEVQLAMFDAFNVRTSEININDVQMGRVASIMVKDIKAGWREIEALGVQVPEEVYNVLMPNLEKLKNRAEMGPFKKAWLEVSAAFKIYATMTPGFVVRNALSATFMNYVAGVESKNIIAGIRAVRAYNEFGPARWLDELGIKDPAVRESYSQAMRAVDATSRGIQSEFMAPTVKGSAWERVLQNRATEAFAKANDFTERAVRFPMALDSILKNQSYDEAIYRVSRYHFDYTDLSKVDSWTKTYMVPFWVFTTRNIPLQITEQLLHPRMYSAYDELRESNPVAADVVMPAWLAQQGPIGLGGNWVLAPDLPHVRLQEQVQSLTDIKSLLGQAYPLFKLPIELAGDRQLAMDIPFTDKYQEAHGLDRVIAGLANIAGIEGIARKNAEGKLEINPRVQYAVGNVIPPIAQIQRLAGGVAGGKSTYADRTLTSWANWAGIPMKEAKDSAARNEYISRQFKLQSELKRLARLGLIPTEDK